MAVLTNLSEEMANVLSRAHGLGDTLRVEGVPAGSVNSNFFLHTESGKVFARIYEEQGLEGVEYEWSLLRHLKEAGLPVPECYPGTEAGEVRVEGKCTALFRVIGGEECCQAMVQPFHLKALGRALAMAHRTGDSFPLRRQSRFGWEALEARMRQIREAGRPELDATVSRLEELLRELQRSWPTALPTGLIHGALFRDNVRWVDEDIVGLLDWESASDGPFVFDLAVTALAWCYGDGFEWELAQNLFAAYEGLRPLTEEEWSALRAHFLFAALRFTVTRITDYHLRPPDVGVKKDYRRFLARLEVFEAMNNEEIRRRLSMSVVP